jgi:hypothetical protein
MAPKSSQSTGILSLIFRKVQQLRPPREVAVLQNDIKVSAFFFSCRVRARARRRRVAHFAVTAAFERGDGASGGALQAALHGDQRPP